MSQNDYGLILTISFCEQSTFEKFPEKYGFEGVDGFSTSVEITISIFNKSAPSKIVSGKVGYFKILSILISAK
jgi:hypothetical protein